MLIKTITVGAYETNCYVVADEKTLECAVIDPGADAGTILDYLEETRLRCRFVLLTHGHFDHTGAVGDILAETDAQLMMHKADVGVSVGGDFYRFVPPEGTKYYADGDVVCVGALSFTVIETPGHTPGSVTLQCAEAGGDETVYFTGDTLFRDSCGRTDFPGSSTEAILRSLKRLADLPGDGEVYPGHGFPSTLARERSVNYFMTAAMRQ